jgi:folate-binding protein YgfZ
MEEYQAVRTRVGLIDASFLGVVRVGGADRVAFLHNLLTQDIKSLTSGSAASAALVTPAGKLISNMIVWAEAEAHWLITSRARVDALRTGLEHYLITENVTLDDQTDAQAILALQGPASQALLTGIPARAVPYSLTGSPGSLLMSPAGGSAALQQNLISRGAVRVGLDTLDVLRIEAGIPRFGVDMDESNLLPETGLQIHAVSESKGCYVGQEVIARMATYGSASRRLMGLVVDAPQTPEAGDPITLNGEPVGSVTSACFSPALNKPIALGYVKRPHYQPGARVEVMRAHPLPATLVTPPFRDV